MSRVSAPQTTRCAMPKKPPGWQQARHSVEPHNKKDSLLGNGVGSLTYPSPQSVSSSFAAHRSCITEALSFEFSCEEKIGLLSFWPPFSSKDQIESNFCGSCELRHRIREVVRQRYAGRSTSSFGGSDACEFQRCFRTTCFCMLECFGCLVIVCLGMQLCCFIAGHG